MRLYNTHIREASRGDYSCAEPHKDAPCGHEQQVEAGGQGVAGKSRARLGRVFPHSKLRQNRTTALPTASKLASIALAAMLAATLLGSLTLTGCRFNQNEVIRRQVREYLTQKYGEVEYEEYTIRPRELNAPYEVFVGYLPGDTPVTEFFEVQRHFDKETRTYWFWDNFYGEMLRSDFEAMAHETVDRFYPDCLMYCVVSATYSTGNDVSLQGAIASDSIYSTNLVIVLSDPEWADEQHFFATAEEFSREWAELGFSSGVQVDYVSQDTKRHWERKGLDYYRMSRPPFIYEHLARTTKGEVESSERKCGAE